MRSQSINWKNGIAIGSRIRFQSIGKTVVAVVMNWKHWVTTDLQNGVAIIASSLSQKNRQGYFAFAETIEA